MNLAAQVDSGLVAYSQEQSLLASTSFGIALSFLFWLLGRHIEILMSVAPLVLMIASLTSLQWSVVSFTSGLGFFLIRQDISNTIVPEMWATMSEFRNYLISDLRDIFNGMTVVVQERKRFCFAVFMAMIQVFYVPLPFTLANATLLVGVFFFNAESTVGSVIIGSAFVNIISAIRGQEVERSGLGHIVLSILIPIAVHAILHACEGLILVGNWAFERFPLAGAEIVDVGRTLLAWIEDNKLFCYGASMLLLEALFVSAHDAALAASVLLVVNYFSVRVSSIMVFGVIFSFAMTEVPPHQIIQPERIALELSSRFCIGWSCCFAIRSCIVQTFEFYYPSSIQVGDTSIWDGVFQVDNDEIPAYSPPDYDSVQAVDQQNSNDSNDEDASVCVICYAAPKTHAFTPCGHKIVSLKIILFKLMSVHSNAIFGFFRYVEVARKPSCGVIESARPVALQRFSQCGFSTESKTTKFFFGVYNTPVRTFALVQNIFTYNTQNIMIFQTICCMRYFLVRVTILNYVIVQFSLQFIALVD